MVHDTATAATAPTSRLRWDIQGLRAVAVILVIANHLVGWPSGGFVGVDIFFVVSGYLISALLLREYGARGHISFSGFYARRARRILPAATVVLLATVAGASVLFSRPRAQDVLGDAIAAGFFGSNWRFAVDGTDYFEAGGPVSPLQHYWSLSVEEQFYFVWPWVLLAVLSLASRLQSTRTRSGMWAPLGVMLVIVVASLVWAFRESGSAPSIAYFSTFARAWELGVGALLAIGMTAFQGMSRGTRTALAWAGLSGIAASVFLIDVESSFPAPWAILPVLSTAFVISAGVGGKAYGIYALANPATKWLGDISYSLYLWHFPAIIFADSLFPGASGLRSIATLSVVFALAIASYYWIEEPFRRVRRRKAGLGMDFSARRRPARGLVFAICILVLVPIPIFFDRGENAPGPSVSGPGAVVPPSGASADLQSELAIAAEATSWPQLVPSVDELSPNVEMGECLNPEAPGDSSCLFGSGDRKVVVIGDSVAAAWIPALRQVFSERGYLLKGITYSTCPFSAVQVDLDMGREASDRCNGSRVEIVAAITEIEPDLVLVLDSAFSVIQTTGLGEDPVGELARYRAAMLSQIEADGRRIVIIQPNPSGPNIEGSSQLGL